MPPPTKRRGRTWSCKRGSPGRRAKRSESSGRCSGRRSPASAGGGRRQRPQQAPRGPRLTYFPPAHPFVSRAPAEPVRSLGDTHGLRKRPTWTGRGRLLRARSCQIHPPPAPPGRGDPHADSAASLIGRDQPACLLKPSRSVGSAAREKGPFSPPRALGPEPLAGVPPLQAAGSPTW